jgi:hypothetical protein
MRSNILAALIRFQSTLSRYRTVPVLYVKYLVKNKKSRNNQVFKLKKLQTVHQCCGSGSVCFWASWIRIR